MQTAFKEAIQRSLPDLGLSDQQFAALYGHFELLRRWNQKMDLTSLASPEEIINRHYCESLFFAMHIPEANGAGSVLDFGSGAGFPGFPLAVLRPTWKVTLLEANQRRGAFLKEAARDIGNIQVITQRGEDLSEKRDWVVARAVKPTDVLNCIPRIAPKVGLLASQATLGALPKTCLRWSEPVLIPGSHLRCCLYGECSNVSRGT